MSKHNSSKKGAVEGAPEAGADPKVYRGPKGNSTVVSSRDELFDANGKLKRKKTAQELNEEFAKKNPAKAREIENMVKKKEQALADRQKKAEEPEIPLKSIPDKYQKFADVAYIQNQTQRNMLIQVIDELEKIDGLSLMRDKEGCLVAHIGKHRVAKLIPYKRLWSFEKTDGKTIRPNPKEAIKIIQEEVKAQSKQLPVAETKVSV